MRKERAVKMMQEGTESKGDAERKKVAIEPETSFLVRHMNFVELFLVIDFPSFLILVCAPRETASPPSYLISQECTIYCSSYSDRGVGSVLWILSFQADEQCRQQLCPQHQGDGIRHGWTRVMFSEDTREFHSFLRLVK